MTPQELNDDTRRLLVEVRQLTATMRRAIILLACTWGGTTILVLVLLYVQWRMCINAGHEG